MTDPTRTTYQGLTEAYDFFNERLFGRLWLVPMLAGGWRFRCLDAGVRPPAPSVGGPAC
jgi:hypothetical protein